MISFKSGEVVLALPEPRVSGAANNRRGRIHDQLPHGTATTSSRQTTPARPTLVRLQFLDAQASPTIVGEHGLPGVVNYLIGNNQARWQTNIPTYQTLVYRSIYPGIDLRYDGAQSQLKGTYTVAPGADPTKIRWRYDGATGVRIDPQGNLVMSLPASTRQSGDAGTTSAAQPRTLTEAAPVAWQVVQGKQVPVSIQYTLASDNTISFTLGNYDPTQPLILDPEITYSTYFGDSSDDFGTDVAVDSAGNAYVTGSIDNTVTGDETAFITKINADGTDALFTTYFGGNDNDAGYGIALGTTGNIYVAGNTSSTDFPITASAYDQQISNTDAFLAIFNPNGTTFNYVTYLGGSAGDGANDVAVDDTGKAYLVGTTASADFPTLNAFDSSFNLDTDTFVAQIDPSAANAASLIYSSYLGGADDDSGHAIAINTTGQAYITGATNSSNFTTANAYDATFDLNSTNINVTDIFVAKISANGSQLLYSTYFGQNGDDQGEGIAVDSTGHAYVTGSTHGMPTTSGAHDSSFGGNSDAFVAKFNPQAAGASSLVYSTYVGGSAYEDGLAITVDSSGRAYATGRTHSDGFLPTSAGTRHGDGDVFVARLTPTGSMIDQAAYVGGSYFEEAYGIALDPTGNVVLTGITSSTDFTTSQGIDTVYGGGNNDAFVVKLNLNRPSIPPDQFAIPETRNCPCNNPSLTPQPSRGGPINTRTGNLWTTALDLQVSSPGPVMEWTRSYSSQSAGAGEGVLGFGWQHSFATRLLLAPIAGEAPTTVIVVSPKGNRLRFKQLSNGQFQPFPGVYSALAQVGNTYVQTFNTQEKAIFNSTGQATTLVDAQGRQLNLEYDVAVPTLLKRVVDATNSQRSFELTYNALNTRITQVTEVNGIFQRFVRYEYDLNGDLDRAFDVMNRHTTYLYQNHLLTGIDNALGEPVERTDYNLDGKAVHQTLQDGQVLDLQYLPHATIITTTGTDGRQTIEEIEYDETNAMTGIRVKDASSTNWTPVQGTAYDNNFVPGTVKDGNDKITTTSFTPLGQPQQITNALNQSTTVEYDAASRPVEVTDTLGRTTVYTYDSHNNIIQLKTGITAAFPQGFTTTFTYNVRYPGKHWLEDQQAPDGVITHYEYNATGLVTSMTVGYGTTLAQTTVYEYDAAGRQTATIVGYGTTLQRRDETHYNNDNTIKKTIQNFKDGSFDPLLPDQDIITSYGYDALGRQRWSRDALGRYDLTHYDAKGRVDWVLQNLYPVSEDSNQQPTNLPTTLPAYTPSQPDANVATLYGFDSLGRTTLVTETGILTGTFNTSTRAFSAATTRVTRTEYDDLNRPTKVTLNYRPDMAMGVHPDVNVQTETHYDPVGNVIGQRDALGRWTVIEYDALNRPIKTIRNYENGNPLTIKPENQGWATSADTDIITVTQYTLDGQVDREIENYVDGAFIATEAITDRVTLNVYDSLGRLKTTTLSHDPATIGSRTDTNRTSGTA